MFCGFYSVISALSGNFVLAAWMIFAGAFLDLMDGKVARFTRSSSKFGVEYDSLADVISFGFAPSILIYMVFGQTMGGVGIFISFLPLLFGSIRLARFNVKLDGFDKDFFSGLPIPIAALTLSSFVIFSDHFFAIPVKFPKTMILLILFVSILMVSTVRYEVAPNINFKGPWREKIKILLAAAGGILLILYPQEVLFPLMILYILIGLTGAVIRIGTGPMQLKKEKGNKLESEN
jgi:CDP-diacylglycerol--serine O-phosphatidyltransferase